MLREVCAGKRRRKSVLRESSVGEGRKKLYLRKIGTGDEMRGRTRVEGRWYRRRDERKNKG